MIDLLFQAIDSYRVRGHQLLQTVQIHPNSLKPQVFVTVSVLVLVVFIHVEDLGPQQGPHFLILTVLSLQTLHDHIL